MFIPVDINIRKVSMKVIENICITLQNAFFVLVTVPTGVFLSNSRAGCGDYSFIFLIYNILLGNKAVIS